MKAEPYAPGPYDAWRYCDTPMFTPPDPKTPARFEIKSASLETLAILNSYSYLGGTPEAEATARLFAAAPDMLEALRGLVDIYNREATPEREVLNAGWRKAFDAIYAATGESVAPEVLETSKIGPGDTVKHRPTGETWVVLRVTAEHLLPAGWPPGRALLADCELLEKATPQQRDEMVAYWERLTDDDDRKRLE